MRNLFIASVFAAAAGVAQAAPITVNINGTLGTDGLPINDGFDNATISGSFVVDPEVSPHPSNLFYDFLSWTVTVTGSNGALFIFDSTVAETGGREEESQITLFTDRTGINLDFRETFEDTSASTGFNQAALLIDILAPRPSDEMSLPSLLEVPGFGSNGFDDGLLQFRISSIPTRLAGAELDFGIAPVPLPASGVLLLVAFGGLGMARRRSTSHR